MAFRRIFLALLFSLAGAAFAAPPVLLLDPSLKRMNLNQDMASVQLPVDAPLDPNALWQGQAGTPVAPGPLWQLNTGIRMVGRITLINDPGADSTYVVQVPISFVDEVRIWWRPQGGAWATAQAGDRIALSQWPFASQFPAFALHVGAQPVELIVAVTNVGPLQVTVSAQPDDEFRESGIRRANLSGLIMGLGVMVTIVSVLGAVSAGRRANWLLSLVCAWALLTISCANGYLAVWFTPDLPGFNDGSKHFTAMVLAGLLVALVAATLDRRYVGRAWRVAEVGVPLTALAYACLQALWLPSTGRVWGALTTAAVTIICCVALGVLNLMRGGRHASLVAAGVGFLMLSIGSGFMTLTFVAGLDLRAAMLATMLYMALLMFRQALIASERYGRDVLGRAAVSANRDPLTALLSYTGFEHAYEEAQLRQAAGGGAASAMMFLLPGLEKSGADYGFVLTERALVRFAAALQGALGDSWSIARLSKTRFACISMVPRDVEQLTAQTTQVLARCARMTQPLAPVADFGLRISCVHRYLGREGLKPMLQEMEHVAMMMDEGKRIAFV